MADAKILAVDDSLVVRTVVKDVLTKEGYEVSLAENGLEALGLLYAGAFNLVVLDIDMPNLNGLQVCRLMKSDPVLCSVPVIMLTARDEKSDKYWGMETGAETYVTKPFQPGDLVDIVKKTLDEFKDLHCETKMLFEREPQVKTHEQIMSESAEIQERQLFQLTLMNEINNIALSEPDYNKTVEKVMSVMNKLVDFNMSAILIGDEEGMEIHFGIFQPASNKFLAEMKNRAVDVYRQSIGEHDFAHMKMRIHDSDGNLLKGREIDAIESFFSASLEAQGRTAGVLCVGSANKEEFTPRSMEMLRMLAAQGYIIVDNARMHDRLKQFAILDGLTRLYNHRFFQEQLNKEYQRTSRYKLKMSLIMIDIDHFKNFNDTYGHQLGDVVLKEVARIMRTTMRDIDLLARYGGEEFVVILPETTAEGAGIVAERLRANVESFIIPHQSGPLRVTISLGVSEFPHPKVADKEDLIARADEAMFQSKREGRNKVTVFTEEE